MQVQGELTQRRFRVYTHETAPRKIEQLELCGMLSHNEKVSPGKELLKPVGFCEWGSGNFSWCPKVALGSMGKTQKALLQEIVDNQNRNNPAYGQFMREQEEERAKSRADLDKAMSQLPRQVVTAYALWIPSILGFGGLHRFYTRHWLSGMGLLFLGLFTISSISSGGFGGIFFGLLSGALFTIWSFVDLFLIPHQVPNWYGTPTVGTSKPSKRIPQPSRPPAPKVSLDDNLLGNRKGLVPDSRLAPRQKTLSQGIVILARNRGSRGFSFNDAVIELDVSPDALRPELEKLMNQDLIESFKGPEGRVLYRELYERYTPGSRPVPKPAPKPQSLSQRILNTGPRSGLTGF